MLQKIPALFPPTCIIICCFLLLFSHHLKKMYHNLITEVKLISYKVTKCVNQFDCLIRIEIKILIILSTPNSYFICQMLTSLKILKKGYNFSLKKN